MFNFNLSVKIYRSIVMIELAKHIEVLLLENDCVIVPGLGGFIAHYRSCVYNEDTGEFCPPARTIGFNPQLVMNDGLLVQSYMQAYNTDFPDATRKIEKLVQKQKEDIYRYGHIYLNNVGTLYYNMNGVYEFEPEANGFFTPSLYGLQGFTFPKLSPENVPQEKPLVEYAMPRTVKTSTRRSSFHYRRWSKNIVAIAAAILLFFLFSIPVENTYLDDAEYASLGSTGLFDAIKNHSMASSIITVSPSVQQQEKKQKTVKKQSVKNNINTLKPVAVKIEKVAAPSAKPAAHVVKDVKQPVEKKTPAANKVPQKATTKADSYIIVASLATNSDAMQVVKQMQQKGYKEAQILESDGRFRVAINRYTNQTDAYKQIKELKKNADFASAWVLTTK